MCNGKTFLVNWREDNVVHVQAGRVANDSDEATEDSQIKVFDESEISDLNSAELRQVLLCPKC